jgi:hypothetical protein
MGVGLVRRGPENLEWTDQRRRSGEFARPAALSMVPGPTIPVFGVSASSLEGPCRTETVPVRIGCHVPSPTRVLGARVADGQGHPEDDLDGGAEAAITG